jgi:outer membrane receptor protein involved in Fe transport
MISGAAIAAVASGAQAQQASAPAPSTSVQELVVTGSRIPAKNLTSVSPVTTVNNQTIKLQGTTNVEDLINNLPQAFADFGQFESNGASGTATVDLRGLGSKRTLVLVDGKRLQPGDPLLPVADLNMIPPALIDRVEVLTGGASAVYGSDAVSGVVNFIMKHNYEGLQFDGEFSIGEHENDNQLVRKANAFGSNSFGFPSLTLPSGAAWAGERYTATISGGANSPDGKGNVEFYLGYTNIQPVLEAKYDWSTCGLATNTSNQHQQYCSGSSTDATGRLGVTSGPNAGHNFDILLPPQPNGLLTPLAPNQYYNFAPLNYIQRPDERYTAGEFSHYEVAPWLDFYSSFMFMDDHTVAQIAPGGSFYGDNTFTIPCNDPLLTAAQANTLCGDDAGVAGTTATAAIGRRDVEGSPRINDVTHEDYRIVFGAKGDIGQGWTYDLSMQYGRSVLNNITTGYFLNDNLLDAINVVPNPAIGGVAGVAAGAPVCTAAIPVNGVAPAPSCVPYNIWNAGGVTKQALAYLNGDAISSGYTSEQVVTANIAGDLGQYGVKSPYSSDGVGVSLGAEYRREYLETNFDAPIQDGQLSGFGGSELDTSGSQADKDVFGEVRVPIVQDVQFFKELVFEGGFRYSDYTSGGGNWTYKAGGDWQITPDIRLRASYERAVRAPNVDELFTPQAPGLVGLNDPCAESLFGLAPALSPEQCLNTFLHSFPGMTVNQFVNGGYTLPNGTVLGPLYGVTPQCPSAQCGLFSGGNPDLKPETADTTSFGFVFTPTFFRGFTFSFDYFNIKVKDAIVDLPATTILNNCATLAIASDCALITRNPQLFGAIYGGNGLGFVSTPTINAGALQTKGFDINADYRATLSSWHLPDYGSLDFNFTGTYVDQLKTTLPDGTSYDCAGLYGLTCGTPTPKWRHQFRMTWSTPWNLNISLAWRFISGTGLDFNTDQHDLQIYEPGQGTIDGNVGGSAKDIAPTDAHIPDYSYFDLSFQYKFENRYTVRGGINNIFDRTPPVLDTNSFGISSPPFGNANTYPQVFDPLGRVFFVGLTADF